MNCNSLRFTVLNELQFIVSKETYDIGKRDLLYGSEALSSAVQEYNELQFIAYCETALDRASDPYNRSLLPIS